jgi:hypothetical protein
MRACGECSLCCKLVPVSSLDKPAGQKCRHQRHRTGCAIYPKRPRDCVWWSCRWLVNDGTENLPRPDHAHYVIDIMPDFVHQAFDSGERRDLQVIQIWVDPAHRDAWREPRCLAYIEMIAATQHLATIIRWSSSDALVVVAPVLCADGQWHEVASNILPEDQAGWQYMLNRAAAS